MTDMRDSGFPTTEQDIQQDPRCSYDTVAQTWILEDEDECYEWNPATGSWKVQDIPQNDELVPEQNQLGDQEGNELKRKAEDELENKPKPKKQPKTKEPRQPKQNSAVWVTGLPKDVTFDELDERFSRWGGMIAKNIDTGRPRIKMYADDDGNFKGEALITFFQPQSVAQAIMMADDRAFRDVGDDRIHVEAASMEYKKHKELDTTIPKEDTRSKKDKAKAKRLHEEQMARLADWSDEDVQAVKPDDLEENKYADTIIVRNMFTLEDLEREKAERKAADAAGHHPEESTLDAIVEDLHDMNDSRFHWGSISSIDVYDAERDGVVRIKFDSPESATNCAKTLPNIKYDGRNLDVEVATKRYRFRKAPRDDEDEAIRLKWFGADATAGHMKK